MSTKRPNVRLLFRSIALLGSLAFASAILGSAGCAADPVDDSSDGYVTTGVSGAGGSHQTTHPSSTSQAAASSGNGAGGNSASGAPYPIVLAHGFFGFNDFAGAGFLTYFYDVKDHLAAEGESDVYTPAVDPFNDSTYRGQQLIALIEQIKAETGKDKVVIIGHSQGGLDARVVAHDRPDLVAAVITVATPHGGSPVADVILGLLSDPNAQEIVDQLVDLIGAPLYDEVGNETAVSKPLKLFSQAGIAAFNAQYPDAPGVFYASIAGRSALGLGGKDCAPDKPVSFIEAENDVKDPLDPLLLITDPILSGGDDKPFQHDGLVRAKDARWGQFWGCVPADHLDEVGQLFGDGPGIGNDWDYQDFYVQLVHHIRTLGY